MIRFTSWVLSNRLVRTSMTFGRNCSWVSTTMVASVSRGTRAGIDEVLFEALDVGQQQEVPLGNRIQLVLAGEPAGLERDPVRFGDRFGEAAARSGSSRNR